MDLKGILKHASESVSFSLNNESGINSDVLAMDGMSSPKIRHLINNLCSKKEISYFEVGSWKGSTFCSALSNNILNNAACCENFSEFTIENIKKYNKTIKEELLENIQKFNNNNNSFDLFEEDFFKKDFNLQNKYNVYLYDGIHTVESQYYQLSVAKKFLDKYSIMIVDDWICKISKPKAATFKALNDFKFYIHAFIELPNGEDGYWNGQGLFVIENL
jgi:hypothetical protein